MPQQGLLHTTLEYLSLPYAIVTNNVMINKVAEAVMINGVAETRSYVRSFNSPPKLNSFSY